MALRRPIPLDIRQALGVKGNSIKPVLNPSALTQRALSYSSGRSYSDLGAGQLQRYTSATASQPTSQYQGYSSPPQQAPGPRTAGPQPYGGGGGGGGGQMQNPFGDWGQQPAPQPTQPQPLGDYSRPGGRRGASLPQTPPGPTPRETTSYIEELIRQQQALAALREEAAGLDAHLATASYDAQLGFLGRDIAEQQAALDRVGPLWTEWSANAQQAIKKATRQARRAYNNYAGEVAGVYGQWMGNISGTFNGYISTVQTMVQEYLDTTNQTYDEFIASLPPMWQPAIDAVAQGDTEAIAALEAREAEAQTTIEGQLVASTESFQNEMMRIGADNPALAEELLADLGTTIDLALQGVALEGDSSQAIAIAAGSVARTAAQYSLAIAMRQNEQARVEAVNEAARQRKQLVDAAAANRDNALANAQVGADQAAIDIQYALDSRLSQLDQQAADLRVQSLAAAQNMTFELTQGLQNLRDNQALTGINRYVAYTQANRNYGSAYQPEILSQTQVGQGEAAMALQALGLPQHDYERILDNVTSLFENGSLQNLNISEDRFTPANIREFLRLLTAAGRDPSLGPDLTNPEMQQAYFAAITAFNRGVENYTTAYLPQVQAVGVQTRPVGGAATGALGGAGASGGGGGGGSVLPSGSYQINQYGFFGSRPNVTGGTGIQNHTGVDMHAPTGTSISAAKGGTLTRYTNEDAGYGVQVVHDDGTVTRYAHINGWNGVPANGTRVAAGTAIAQVGQTGNAKASHLHLTYLVNGQPVDPIAYGIVGMP